MVDPREGFKDKPVLMVDSEFESQIPPLTEEEFQQLEENILADGVVLQSIIVWDGVIIDGHNRWRIIKKHPFLKYTVYEMSFPDRYAAIIWICKNQLGRRNLTPEQKKYLIGKQYGTEKDRSPFRGNQYTIGSVGCGQNVHNQPGQRTSERISDENNVNEKYVRRAEQFAKGIDLADEIDPGIRKEILSGSLHPTDKRIYAVAKATTEERPARVQELRNPPDEEKEPLPDWSSMLVEMTDALDSLIFRWKFCQTNNPLFFVDLYHGEYDPYRLIAKLRHVDPLTIPREGLAAGVKYSGYKKYLSQVLDIYNGSSVKTALPVKF